MLERLLVHPMLASDGHVDTTILTLTSHDNIRWHILRESGARLNHRAHAHTCLGVLYHRGGEDDTVLDVAVASNLRTIAKDATVAHFRVVRDVRTLHEEVIIADNGLSPLMSGTVDDHILADDIMITNHTLRLLPTELEVLG